MLVIAAAFVHYRGISNMAVHRLTKVEEHAALVLYNAYGTVLWYDPSLPELRIQRSLDPHAFCLADQDPCY